MKPPKRASQPWFLPLMRGATNFALAISCAVLLVCTSIASSADPLFATPWISFDAGYEPISVAMGDLNGDGNPDLVVANYTSGTVSVLLGNGDGTCGPKSDYVTGNNSFPHPASVAIGDLNADGKPDLAVANFSFNRVSVLLGNGNGTFGPKTDYATGGDPSSVAIGDLNRDGNPDLALANQTSNTVSVLLGNGDGTFPKSNYETGSGPFSVAIGDLNQDGRSDLATANAGFNTVTILLNISLDFPTATLVSRFWGDANEHSIRLRWELRDGSQARGFNIERAEDNDAYYQAVHLDPRPVRTGSEYEAVDSDVQPGARYRYRLEVLLDQGSIWQGPIEVQTTRPTTVLTWQGASPNPFRASVELAVAVPRSGTGWVTIYDIAGHEVRRIGLSAAGPGSLAIRWDGRDDRGRVLAAGIYQLRAHFGDVTATRSVTKLD